MFSFFSTKPSDKSTNSTQTEDVSLGVFIKDGMTVKEKQVVAQEFASQTTSLLKEEAQKIFDHLAKNDVKVMSQKHAAEIFNEEFLKELDRQNFTLVINFLATSPTSSESVSELQKNEIARFTSEMNKTFFPNYMKILESKKNSSMQLPPVKPEYLGAPLPIPPSNAALPQKKKAHPLTGSKNGMDFFPQDLKSGLTVKSLSIFIQTGSCYDSADFWSLVFKEKNVAAIRISHSDLLHKIDFINKFIIDFWNRVGSPDDVSFNAICSGEWSSHVNDSNIGRALISSFETTADNLPETVHCTIVYSDYSTGCMISHFEEWYPEHKNKLVRIHDYNESLRCSFSPSMTAQKMPSLFTNVAGFLPGGDMFVSKKSASGAASSQVEEKVGQEFSVQLMGGTARLSLNGFSLADFLNPDSKIQAVMLGIYEPMKISSSSRTTIPDSERSSNIISPSALQVFPNEDKPGVAKRSIVATFFHIASLSSITPLEKYTEADIDRIRSILVERGMDEDEACELAEGWKDDIRHGRHVNLAKQITKNVADYCPNASATPGERGAAYNALSTVGAGPMSQALPLGAVRQRVMVGGVDVSAPLPGVPSEVKTEPVDCST